MKNSLDAFKRHEYIVSHRPRYGAQGDDEMTPQEIQHAIATLAEEIGPKAHISLSINEATEGGVICASVWPGGLLAAARDEGRYFSVRADDWAEVLSLARARWAELADLVAARTIRTMALAIIRITADQGGCSDAALRAGGFNQDEIDRYGADACADADAIASNGPFAITVIANANAA